MLPHITRGGGYLDGRMSLVRRAAPEGDVRMAECVCVGGGGYMAGVIDIGDE